MSKVIVGRHINGITLNPLEYITTDEGDIMYFDGEDAAKQFLRDHGVDEEDCEWLVFKESTELRCFRCGSPLFPSEVDGYKYQCFTCDEDFYGFEQEDRK